MTRLEWAVVVAFACLLLNPARSAERPNILFVYTDDQAAWALGAAGNPDAHTPRLDELAASGARFTNAFTVTPVCSPSRASLMTSRYGTELGITDWIQPKTEPELGLDSKWVVWPELLQQAGYQTGLFGKWHLGVPAPYHPTRHGFDRFVGFLEGGTRPRNPILEVAGELKTMEGFSSDVITTAALEFLDQQTEQPFAICVHFRAPHAPYLPVGAQDWEPLRERDLHFPSYPDLDEPKVARLTREYLASVAEVDRNVGRMLDRLKARGLEDNTLVIFTSDHGYNIGHHGVWHKGNGHWIVQHPPEGTPNIPRGQRPNMFDTSLKVPALVRWPGQIRPHTVLDQTTSNLDWYPTLIAAAGIEPPQTHTLLGANLLPVLRGESPQWDEYLFAQYSTHHTSQTQMRVARTPDWKLMRDFLNPGRDELYHLAVDPDESRNLIASDDPEARGAYATLNRRLLASMRAIQDPALENAQP